MANPTTNYSFAMPTNTDLVKDLPADFEVFGQAVDTQMKTNADAVTTAIGTTIQKSIVDAKGDLIAATAADTVARLAVGTDGQALVADSTTSTGLKWATSSGWNPNYQLINTGGTALSGTSTTVSGISAMNSLYVVVIGASTTSGNSWYIRLNGDSTTGNYWDFYYGSNSGAGVTTNGDAIPNYWSQDAGNFSSWNLRIEGANAAGIKPFALDFIGSSEGSWYHASGNYKGTSTISSVSFINNSGATFDAGTIYVYGA